MSSSSRPPRASAVDFSSFRSSFGWTSSRRQHHNEQSRDEDNYPLETTDPADTSSIDSALATQDECVVVLLAEEYLAVRDGAIARSATVSGSRNVTMGLANWIQPQVELQAHQRGKIVLGHNVVLEERCYVFFPERKHVMYSVGTRRQGGLLVWGGGALTICQRVAGGQCGNDFRSHGQSSHGYNTHHIVACCDRRR